VITGESRRGNRLQSQTHAAEDPRVYKSWGDYAGFDWKRLYTKALQKKFAWVEQTRTQWKAINVESEKIE
jgi:hypothetical protein